MTARQAGQRISSIAAARQTRRHSSVGSRKKQPGSPKEKRRLLQLVACGSIFVLLVAVKLLLPGRMAQIDEKLSAVLQQNVDMQAVFSAVGKAVSGEESVGGTLDEVYQAVFHPEQEAVETTARLPNTRQPADGEPPAAENPIEGRSDPLPAKTGAAEQQSEVASLAYVLYSSQNLPENVSMEQTLLGFDYCTPVFAPLSSGFGYREHPVEGEERFHYGVDLAAEMGADIACFADGTVTAVGESSSYGKYLIVEHADGYSSLYAHCRQVTASSGAKVKRGGKIAEVGESGMATGPHLHFELHRNSTYLNPIYYVAQG